MSTPIARGRAGLLAAGLSLVMLSAGQTAAAGTTASALRTPSRRPRRAAPSPS